MYMHLVYVYLVANVPVLKGKKSVKEIDVRCKKSVKCVFSLSPTGIAISCITFSSGGKICNSGKEKVRDRNV